MAKRLKIEPKALFTKLKEVNYIVRESDKWTLTAKGKLAGGKIKTSEKLGDYIEWPEDFNLEKLPQHQTPDIPIELISSTKIGTAFGISANKLNYLLAELGWVSKSMRGWVVTEHGTQQGAEQNEDSRTGIPYVKWPETITESKLLLNSINAITFDSVKSKAASIEKTKATHSTIDGHWVHTKAEMLIDNWLYMAEIAHAYERKLPIVENVHCTFYIPTGKVYIEYWSACNDLKHIARKEKKRAIYQKYGFKLIELDDTAVQNLDDFFPRLLLKFGVQAY